MRLCYFSSPINSYFKTRTRSNPVKLDIWILVGPFVYYHTSCVRTAKTLARLRECAGSPEPSLVAYMVSTIISWADSYHTLGKSSNRSLDIFSILAKLSNIQKIPYFGRKVLYVRNEYSNYHFGRSAVSASMARKRWVPLFFQSTPNHNMHMT